MPADPASLTGMAPGALVHRLIAEVLAVPVERILPETRLTAELGAESIDYVDLIFRLEEALGVPVTVSRWAAFLRSRLPEHDHAALITAALVQEFVVLVTGEAPSAVP